MGAEVRRGDLDDLDGLAAAAAETDGVIHLAFKHEAMRTGDFMGAVDSDMAATPGDRRGPGRHRQAVR